MQTPVWLDVLGAVLSGLCFLAFWTPFIMLIVIVTSRVERVYQNRISQWANENGWEIMHHERRLLKHPWFVFLARNQRVYYVALKYQDGRPFYRHAWLRCGGSLWRPAMAKVECVWDERVPQPLPPPSPVPEVVSPRDNPLWDRWLDS